MLAQCSARSILCWGHVSSVGPMLLCWRALAPGHNLGLRWRTLGLCWPILGAMLAHLGGYVGSAHLWGHEGDVGGCVGPSLGLCWAQLGAMLAHLQPKLTYVGSLLNVMLGHVDPS